MDATRPLLAGDRDGDDGPHYNQSHLHSDSQRRRTARRSSETSKYHHFNHQLEDERPSVCSRLLCCFGDRHQHATLPTSGYKELPPHRDPLLSNGTTSSTGSSSHTSGYHGNGQGAALYGYDNRDAEDGSLCAKWACWKWMFPDRITDYDDFASSEEMGEIHFLRQKTRESFDVAHPDDEEMLQRLWQAMFPTLPYDGRVNPRWRDIGFQNDDPASDFRSSGRFGCKMLLYFADHMNDEFKRLVRENRFPVCLVALNVIEMILIHLNLKDPLPLVCPCCGTDNAELVTSHPSRDRPELKGFTSILADCVWTASSLHLAYSPEWPVEVAFAQLFMNTMIVVDRVWRQKLHRDPTTNLLHFREALFESRKKLVAFLSRHNSPVSLIELSAWSSRLHSTKLKPPSST